MKTELEILYIDDVVEIFWEKATLNKIKKNQILNLKVLDSYKK